MNPAAFYPREYLLHNTLLEQEGIRSPDLILDNSSSLFSDGMGGDMVTSAQ